MNVTFEIICLSPEILQALCQPVVLPFEENMKVQWIIVSRPSIAASLAVPLAEKQIHQLPKESGRYALTVAEQNL